MRLVWADFKSQKIFYLLTFLSLAFTFCFLFYGVIGTDTAKTEKVTSFDIEGLIRIRADSWEKVATYAELSALNGVEQVAVGFGENNGQLVNPAMARRLTMGGAEGEFDFGYDGPQALVSPRFAERFKIGKTYSLRDLEISRYATAFNQKKFKVAGYLDKRSAVAGVYGADFGVPFVLCGEFDEKTPVYSCYVTGDVEKLKQSCAQLGYEIFFDVSYAGPSPGNSWGMLCAVSALACLVLLICNAVLNADKNLKRAAVRRVCGDTGTAVVMRQWLKWTVVFGLGLLSGLIVVAMLKSTGGMMPELAIYPSDTGVAAAIFAGFYAIVTLCDCLFVGFSEKGRLLEAIS